MALALTRKANQGVTFKLPNGDIIHVMLGNMAQGRVQVCVDAPQDVQIVRDELLEFPKERQHGKHRIGGGPTARVG